MLTLGMAGSLADAAASAPNDLSRLKTMSVDELMQQEVVSVSRRPESWATAPSNVFLITNRAANATGALSLPELLRLAPNVFVAQSSSYHWGVQARGFMRTNAYSNKMLVLVDGRSAYSPLFSNVFWDSTDVFVPDVESIEVISGPSGANWGSNAVNGVININSKNARDTVGGLTQVAAGTEGTQLAVRQGFAVGSTGAFRVYAKRNDRDATLSTTGADDEYDDWESTQVGFRADWGSLATGEFTVQGDGLSGRYAAGALPEIANDSANLIARYARELSSYSQFWVRGYYDYVKRDTSGFLTETTHTVDVEFQHQTDFTENQTLLWGGNFRRFADEATDSVGFAILPSTLWYNLAGGFAQHELRLANDRLRLITGGRVEHNHFSDWEFQPSVRLAWRKEKNMAWLAVSRSTRTPSRLDTGFFAPETPPYIIAGGPDFDSEKVDAYEIGWRGQPAAGRAFTATVYLHEYDDLRTVELETPIIQANGARGRSYGAEVFMDYDINPRWRLRAGGFVMRQENWLKAGSLDAEGARGEMSFPEYQLFVRNTFRLSENTDLWLSWRAVDAVPALEEGGGEAPAYTELDACLRWRFRPNLEAALVGRNLLDKSHPEIGGLNTRREIQRSGHVSLSFHY